MMNQIHSRTLRAGLLALAIAAAGALTVVSAQTEPAAKPTVAPANVLSIADIESRMLAQGITIKEIELRDLLAEVEGFTTDGRKVELIIDRRSGETLSQKIKARK